MCCARKVSRCHTRCKSDRTSSSAPAAAGLSLAYTHARARTPPSSLPSLSARAHLAKIAQDARFRKLAAAGVSCENVTAARSCENVTAARTTAYAYEHKPTDLPSALVGSNSSTHGSLSLDGSPMCCGTTVVRPRGWFHSGGVDSLNSCSLRYGQTRFSRQFGAECTAN
jgi:hypothetical protein